MAPLNASKEETAGVSTSNHVYIRSKEHAWVPGRLINVSANEAVVQVGRYRNQQAIGSRAATRGSDQKTVKLSDYPNNALPLQNIGEDGQLKEVEDMVDLSFLHEVRSEMLSLYLPKKFVLSYQFLTRFTLYSCWL
jgi:hypothetical protein